ncbi:MAG: hypothetical protein ACR2O6_01930 [Ilumatobacteraceae bacterium]
MCHRSCVDFTREQLDRSLVEGRSVIEVGSQDVNGSTREMMSLLGPASYLGVDIEDGSGVDQICRIESLAENLGPPPDLVARDLDDVTIYSIVTGRRELGLARRLSVRSAAMTSVGRLRPVARAVVPERFWRPVARKVARKIR